ncbi:MAG: hypothetical protein IIX90_04230 [Clostridia bacterium]|nr:hypothetical protein [Clostridia bacterium]MBQ1982048.1 hypothetical protein [Clostridia bacterium]
MKLMKILSLVLAICLLGCAFIACDSGAGDAETTVAETKAETKVEITLIIKNGSTTVDESTITCDGTLGNAIELYCAGEGYEEECFNTSGILTAIGELTTADGKRWSAYYEDQGSSKAFASIKDQAVENGKTVVVVLG